MMRCKVVGGALFLTVAMLAGCGDVKWFPDNNNVVEPTPAAFTFTPKTCVAASTVTESADVDVTGVTSVATVKVSGGDFSLDGGKTWQNTATLATPKDQKLTVRVRHTSAAVPVGTTEMDFVITSLSVGNTTGIFYSVTDVGQTICR